MAKNAKWYAGWVRNAYAQTAEEKQTNLEAADFIEYLAAELEAVKRERDALKRDLYMRVNGEVTTCYICKFLEENCDREVEMDECFVWRGLCKENGGVEE